MRAVGLFRAGLLVAAQAATALAHGGTYGPPRGGSGNDPGPPLGPPWHPPHFHEPEETPGNGDPKGAVTRWETWWAGNKDAYLHLAERLAADTPGATPTSRPLSERAKDAAAKRDAALRRRLAGVFIEALGDTSFEVRTAAAIALGKCGEPDGSEPLRTAAKKDAHKDVRDSAVLGLGLLGRPADIPFLDAMLADPAENPRRRAFAAFALGLIGGEDAAISLVRFAGDRPGGRPAEGLEGKPELASSVFVAMGLTGDPGVLAMLRAAAEETGFDENVRSFAIISLGRMGDRGSLVGLSRMLASERDPALRRASAVALGRIAEATDAAAVTGLLTAMTSDRDELTRHFAAVAVGGIRSDAVRTALRRRFADGTEGDRAFAALAIGLQGDLDFAPTLRGVLEGPIDESGAGSLCIALGLLGDIASAPAIEKTLADAKSIWVQGYAALSLGLVGSTKSVEALRKRLDAEKDPRLRMNLAIALGMLHDPRAKDYLVDTFRGADTFYERSSAAMALGALRLAATVPDLEAVYRNPNEKEVLRAFSVVALGEIADPSPVPKLTRFAVDGNYDAAVKVDPLNEILSIY